MHQERTITILIIDDDVDGRFTYKRFLHKIPNFNISVYEASTGLEGIELYQTVSPDFVLLDYLIPGMNGIEILERLRKIDPQAIVIMLTGVSGEDIAAEAIKHGATGYLSKDKVDVKELQRLILRALEMKS